jgi:hypothetical protein
MLKPVGVAALIIGLSMVSASAQNMQGPGGTNYGAGSTPQTGGINTPVQSSPESQPSPRTAPHFTQRGRNGRLANHGSGNRYGALGTNSRIR